MSRSGAEPPVELGTELGALRGVGPARSQALAEQGYHTVEDLLFHLPLRYEDRRTMSTVSELVEPGWFSLRARVRSLRRVRVRRRGLSLVRGLVEDETGSLAALWFNRPYLPNQIDEEVEYFLHGELRQRGEGWELLNATLERPEEAAATQGVVPIYPSVQGLGATLLRKLMRQVVELAELQASVPEYLPPELLRQRRLPLLGQALLDLHRPKEEVDVEALNDRRSPAHRRLAYGELLDQQVELRLSREDARSRGREHRYPSRERLDALLDTVPPFELTAAQRRAAGEILDDLDSDRPMLRLLQGDVGCGKTIVAVIAMVAAARGGLQAALMAPTELLAEQHAASLRALLPEGIQVGLLTSSVEDGARVRSEIASGQVRIVVGTHALIQESVDFQRLALVVVDEQHRFGVGQRRALQGKGEHPDLLVMTATPIPRSLALAVYGDLDLSVIDELPPGRRPVDTRVVAEADSGKVYGWLERRLQRGSQAFVVLPFIEQSDRVAAASIDRRGEALAARFAPHSPAVLHGRTPPEERRRTLERFASGAVRMLIATTIIEVGLDVADADLMVIESAERFGLSQLHQLRGRVGRGEAASFCIALHGELTEPAEQRLEAFVSSTDGFRLAERDLTIRGQGDLSGTRQAGAPAFRVANLVRDRKLLEQARGDARTLLRDRDEVTSHWLRRLRERQGDRHDRLAGG